MIFSFLEFNHECLVFRDTNTFYRISHFFLRFLTIRHANFPFDHFFVLFTVQYKRVESVRRLYHFIPLNFLVYFYSHFLFLSLYFIVFIVYLFTFFALDANSSIFRLPVFLLNRDQILSNRFEFLFITYRYFLSNRLLTLRVIAHVSNFFYLLSLVVRIVSLFRSSRRRYTHTPFRRLHRCRVSSTPTNMLSLICVSLSRAHVYIISICIFFYVDLLSLLFFRDRCYFFFLSFDIFFFLSCVSRYLFVYRFLDFIFFDRSTLRSFFLYSLLLIFRYLDRSFFYFCCCIFHLSFFFVLCILSFSFLFFFVDMC